MATKHLLAYCNLLGFLSTFYHTVFRETNQSLNTTIVTNIMNEEPARTTPYIHGFVGPSSAKTTDSQYNKFSSKITQMTGRKGARKGGYVGWNFEDCERW